MLFALPKRPRRADPVAVYSILMAWQAVCFSLFFTVQLIYHVTVVGLDPFRMVLVGAVLEVTWVLFELPTGVVADVYSRRLSILVGLALMGGSYLIEGGIPAFWAALVSQVFWGVGGTFTSGATEAWITDEVGEESVGPVFLRGEQMRLAGVLTGTLLSTALGLVAIQAPMVLAGVGMLALAGSLALVMPERPVRAAAADGSPVRRMTATARAAVRVAMARPVAKIVIAASLVSGLAAEAWDRLSTPSLIDRFAFPAVFGAGGPVLWFGIAGVVGTLLGLAASEVFRRTNPTALGAGAPARLLAGLAAVDVAAVAGFALAGHLWLAFAMVWVRRIVATIEAPVQAAWLNRNLDPATRATVISMTSQANSAGQAVGGPALGWLGSAVSLRAALLGSALVLAPTIALYGRLVVRERAVPDPAPTPAD